jgi:hypothetical protein
MNNQKRPTSLQFKLHEAETLLKKIDSECQACLTDNCGENWEDNLFEIVMTRLELIAQHKKEFKEITKVIKENPLHAVKLLKTHIDTMHNILTAAKAPAKPITVLAFSILYFGIIDSFNKDESEDLSKTMITLNKSIERLKKLHNL